MYKQKKMCYDFSYGNEIESVAIKLYYVAV